MTPGQAGASAESAHLDVVVLHARDAEAATAGGADRLLLGIEPDEGYLSPDPATVSAVVRDTDRPVYVVLRSPELSYRRLVDLGSTFLELGARGLAFGFLDRDLEIDRETCTETCQ
ncbi:MAG: hypothetical protein ABWY19_00990 [Marmoricola sp.]